MNWNLAKSHSSDLEVGWGGEGSLPSPGEGGQVSSHQGCFCQSYKNWSESNGSVSGICKAASPLKFLKHITYSRVDSPVLSHALLIHILIKTRRIWELRPEGPVQEHTLDPFPCLSGGNSKAVTGTLASLEIQSIMTTNANHQNPAGEVRQLWSRTGLCDSITFALA